MVRRSQDCHDGDTDARVTAVSTKASGDSECQARCRASDERRTLCGSRGDVARARQTQRRGHQKNLQTVDFARGAKIAGAMEGASL